MIPSGLRNILAAVGCMVLLSSVHFPSESYSCIPEPTVINIKLENLADGDVILRNGTGIISEFFASCSFEDRSFSHAGILLSTDSGWVVFHALGGESAGDGGIRVDKLSGFCSRKETDTVNIFRLTDEVDVRSRIRSYCIRKADQGVKFDRGFSLKDTSAMYCTEFIYRAFKSAGSGLISLPLTRFDGIEYVSCDNLYLNKYAHQVPH